MTILFWHKDACVFTIEHSKFSVPRIGEEIYLEIISQSPNYQGRFKVLNVIWSFRQIPKFTEGSWIEDNRVEVHISRIGKY